MKHDHANPTVTTYPAGDAQCVLDCAAGACDDPPEDKVTSHANVMSYAGHMAQGQQNPPPCPPCTVEDLKALHAAKGKAASTINWAALLTLLTTLLAQLIPSLFPPAPAPTPTPATKK